MDMVFDNRPSIFSEMPEIATPTRQKVTTACIGCQARRIRCTGVAPCDGCKRQNRVCKFMEPTKKRGPQKDYKQRVSEQIELIEKTLIKLQHRIEKHKQRKKRERGSSSKSLHSRQGKTIINIQY